MSTESGHVTVTVADLREVAIRLRISEEDRNILQAAARKRGMTLSDFLRETAVKAAQGAALA